MITIKLDDKELQRYLDKISERWGDPKPLFKAIVPILHNSIVENFRAGGRPQRWAPLSPMTIAIRKWRAKQGKGRGFRNIQGVDQPILIDTGKLLQSIGSVKTITKRYLEYGTNDPRAPKLQGTGFGYEHGTPVVVPKRIIRPKKAKALKIPLDGGFIFRKKVVVPERRTVIPGRPFILFQDEDIETIVGYAAAFAFSDEPLK